MATSSASSPPELGKKKRHATLTDQDMEDILKKRNAANTDEVTGNSVNIIRKYLNEKNLPVDFESLDGKALDEPLSKFDCEVRTFDGELYKKSCLMTLRHGINRHLSNSRKSPVDIVNANNFNQSQRMFSAISKELKRAGKAKIEHYPPRIDADIEKMYEYLTSDLDDPVILQRKVFVDVLLYFCRRGLENLRDIKIMDIAVTRNDENTPYAYMVKDEATKNHQADDKASVNGHMFEILGRCFY